MVINTGSGKQFWKLINTTMEINILTLKENYYNILSTTYKKFSETRNEIEEIEVENISEDMKTTTIDFLYLLKIGHSLFYDDTDLLSIIRSHFKYEGPFLLKLFRKDDQYNDKIDLRIVLPPKKLHAHEKKIISRLCASLKIPSSEQDDFINKLQTGRIKTSGLFSDPPFFEQMDSKIEQIIEVDAQPEEMNLNPMIFDNYVNMLEKKIQRYLHLNRTEGGRNIIEDQIMCFVKAMFILKYYCASTSCTPKLDAVLKKLIKDLCISAVSNYITSIINTRQFTILLFTAHQEIKSDFPQSCSSKSGIGQGVNHNLTESNQLRVEDLTPSSELIMRGRGAIA